MRCNAIGFVEVVGLVAAIEAGDAMAKAAQVRLLKYHHITPGLVTVVVEGDLASCRAAVDAGVAAATRVGQVVNSLVLGRPDRDTEALVLDLLRPEPADRPASTLRKASATQAKTVEFVPQVADVPAPDVVTAEGGAPLAPISPGEPAGEAEVVITPPIEQAVEVPVADVLPAITQVQALPEMVLPTLVAEPAVVELPAPETLLAYVSAAARGRTCQEVARRFQLPPAKAREILDHWVAEGHLEKSGSRYLLPQSLF